MTSDRWTDRLSEYIDDALPAAERARLEAHLAGCAECARTVEELRAVVRAAVALRDAPPERDLWAGIAGRIETPVIPFHAARTARRLSFTLPQLAAASVALVAVSGALVWALLSRAPAAGGPVAVTPAALPPASAGPLPAPAGPSATAPVAPAGTRLAGLGGDTSSAAGAPAAEPGAAPRAERPLGRERSGARRPGAGAAVVLASDADRRRYDQAVDELEAVLRRGRGRLQPETVQALEHSLSTIDNAIAEARRALARDPGSPYLNAHLTDSLRRKVELLQQVSSLVGQS
ncbi:MAG TPA: anti-sigma factor [Longimicrobiales bacterium]|nr:anti-sigma factor [Longimicrobiales bacterium]